MEPRVSLITLGVADLDRAKAFYSEVLGWKSFGPETGIVFYNLNGVILSLYPHNDLAKDIGCEAGPPPQGYTGMALAHNLPSEAAVDALLAKIKAGGGRILKPAAKTFWGGYAGYFADPDGHPWEAAHNPHWSLAPDGRIVPPEA